MAEQSHHSGEVNRFKAPRGPYTDAYPTEDSLPRITSMDFTDHHTGSDGRMVRTLSLYSGFGEVAGFPIDDYFVPSSDDDDGLLKFKVHGFTYEDLEDGECEDDEGHAKGYSGAKVVLLVLEGGVLPNPDDFSGEGTEYPKDVDIVLSPYQLMSLIDTYYRQLPLKGSAYGMRLFR